MNDIDSLIRAALSEDDAHHDVTSRTLIPRDRTVTGRFIAKEEGVLCGIDAARKVFSMLDRSCRVSSRFRDGKHVAKGTVFATVTGSAVAVLSGERTALNFMQRMSGVATLTARYVKLARGTKAKIYDTRKTLPGFRELDKYAVRCGGGENHRMSLSDMALIKDNHLTAISGMSAAVKKIKQIKPGIPVEIECETTAQVTEALDAGADIIMLDNMDAGTLRKAVAMVHARRLRPRIEISGGVNLNTVRAFARLGVDRISVGALTHSAPALDISLELDLK